MAGAMAGAMGGVLAATDFEFRWEVVAERQDLIWAGVRYTLYIAALSMTLALALGLAIALLRLSRVKPVAWLAAGYINVFRAIPLLVFLIWVYFGISLVIGFNFTPVQAGVLVLTMQYGAWLAEIFRSGIQAIPKGQREAALAVGMGKVRTFVSITLPQALRIVVPPTGNMFVGMVKDSSLVSVIGVFELLRTTQLLVNQTFRPFEFYTAAAAVYIALTVVIGAVVNWLERRTALVDPLAGRARRLPPGPVARRRLGRLRALQDAVGGGASPA